MPRVYNPATIVDQQPCSPERISFPLKIGSNGVDLRNAENVPQEFPDAFLNSAQPNILSAAPDAVLMTAKMWVMVLLTGIGAGITSGLLMRLLRMVQHLSFSYWTGDFLAGVRNTSADHRVVVVSLGGLLAGLSLCLLRRCTGGSGAEVTGAIWHKKGQFEAAPTIAKSLISTPSGRDPCIRVMRAGRCQQDSDNLLTAI